MGQSSEPVDVQRGYRVKKFCKKTFKTVVLRALSTHFNLPGTSIHNWFSGKNIPNSALIVFAKHGCNIEWLLTGEGSMMRESSQLPAISPGTPPEKLREMARQLNELAEQLENSNK